MNPIALYTVLAQEPRRSTRDGVVTKRRSRRPSRRNATRSFL